LLVSTTVSDLYDPFTERIIGCAMEVHRATGAGLLEAVYDVCFAFELEVAGFSFRRQCSIPIEYKSLSIQTAFSSGLCRRPGCSSTSTFLSWKKGFVGWSGRRSPVWWN